MKLGDEVILLGFIDGCSYETTGQTNFIIALETGERVEVPIECVIEKKQVVKKDEIKLKDIIRRINRLDENSKTDWLDTILNWFSLDFGLTKYRQGYEQGKIEGAWVGNQLKDADKIRQELNKPVVPQFVADWYETHKDDLEYDIWEYILRFEKQQKSEFYEWMNHANNKPLQTLANMQQFGYEVKKEPKYMVKVKGIAKYKNCLVFGKESKTWFFASNGSEGVITKHTRKQLEEARFGEVFNSTLFEVEEVE